MVRCGLLGVRAERLDDAIAAHHAGIGIHLSSSVALPDIKQILKQDGGGRTSEILRQSAKRQVEITLPHKFKLSGSTRLALASLWDRHTL